jgi:hypothetical protein
MKRAVVVILNELRRLAVPTLAQRVAGAGDAVIFNNVSPGAAMADDPDAFGTVYHRVLSRGPGGAPVAEPLRVALDAAGDRAMTERFVIEAMHGQAALCVLWLGEPDHIQHEAPLGSPEHLAVLREADRHAGMVMRAVEQRRGAGEDILLIVGSGHGHETVSGAIDIEAKLIAAGLKEADGSSDVLALSNGTASLIFLRPDHDARRDRMEDFLRTRPWVGQVVPAEALRTIGQAPLHGLAFAVSMKGDETVNEYGVPGHALQAVPRWDKKIRTGCGQHGGLNTYENMPVLLIEGAGFAGGMDRPGGAHITDPAPTILRHLGLPQDGMAHGMDGRAMQA